jgi:PAS domain S-box-containing protein
MSGKKILVVEDEFITGADLQSKLKKMGYDVPVVVDTGRKAIQTAGEMRPDLVLMDITLKEEMTGIEAAERIGSDYNIPVIFLTAHSDDATVEKAVKSVPFGYLIKPLDERALKTTIQMALYKHEIDAQIRQRDTTIKALINANPEPMFIIDQKTSLLVINDVCALALDKSCRPTSHMTLDTLVSAGIVSPKLADAVREHFYDGSPYTFEDEFRDKWIAYTITPLPDKEGRIERCAIHGNDITGIKRAQQNLKGLNQQLEKDKKRLSMFATMIDSMDDFIIGTDEIGKITFVNEAFRKRFGYSTEEVMDKHISTLQDPKDPFAIDMNRFIIDKTKVWNGNFVALNKYNLRIRMMLKSSPVIHEDNTMSRVFVLRERMGD